MDDEVQNAKPQANKGSGLKAVRLYDHDRF
jgi:hypothetical protein